MSIHVIGYSGSARLRTLIFAGPPPGAIKVEFAFGYGIFDESPVWTDVATDLLSLRVTRGRNHELDRIEAGTLELTLNNAEGNWWRNNTAGAYYGEVGNVKPLTPVRVIRSHAGTDYPVFRGVAESFEPDWLGSGGFFPVMSVKCVDLFEALSRYKLEALKTDLTAEFTAVGEITSDAAAAQPYVVVNPADLTDAFGRPLLHIGQQVWIRDDDHTDGEILILGNIIPATSTLMMTTNLTNSYATSKHACIKKFPRSLTGARVTDCLKEVGGVLGMPDSLMSIDAGQKEVIEHVPPTGGTNIMEHLFKVAEAEDGRLFVSTAGVVTFLDSTAPQRSPYNESQATFKDDESECEYISLDLADDNEFIYNEASVKGEGFDTEQACIDTEKQETQGPRVLTKSDSLLADAGDAFVRAYVYVARYSDSKFRCRGLHILPDANPDVIYPVVLGLDILSRIRLQLNDSKNLAELDEYYHIEGVEHEWDGDTNLWKTTWQLWDVNQFQAYGMTTGPTASGLYNTGALETYAHVHDEAACFAVEDVAAVGQRQTATPGDGFYIWRTVLEFDTTDLAASPSPASGVVVVQVQEFDHLGFGGPLDNDLTVHLVPCPAGTDIPLEAADYGDLLAETTDCGSFTIPAGRVPTATYVIPLTAAGLALLVPGGVTRFGLRSAGDISATAPDAGDIDYVGIVNGDSFKPKLILHLA